MLNRYMTLQSQLRERERYAHSLPDIQQSALDTLLYRLEIGLPLTSDQTRLAQHLCGSQQRQDARQ